MNWWAYAPEVGGRWSNETRSSVSQLDRERARHERERARHETAILQKRAEQAWRMRWGCTLSCAAAKAVAMSLWGLCASWELEGDHRHAGLAP